MVEIFGMPVIYVHLGALLILIVSILFADKHALAWVRGKEEVLEYSTMERIHIIVWIGLIVMIISGVLLALPIKGFLVANVAFYVKMFFVVTLVVNSFFISSFIRTACERPFTSVTKKEKKLFIISGGVSVVGWLGAFISALFMSASQWTRYFLSIIF